METAIVYIDKCRKTTKYSRLEWSANDHFQLQRMVHEELGMGTWTGCAGVRDIPVTTEKGQVLAVLDCTDPEHPILKRESTSNTNKESVIDANYPTPTSHLGTNATSDHELSATTTDVESTLVVVPASSPVSADSTHQSGGIAAAVSAQHGNERAGSGSGASSGVEDTVSVSEPAFLPGSPFMNHSNNDQGALSQA